MITVTTCPHGVDLRFAKCLMCDDPAFHAAARTRLDSVNTATTIPQSWSGHAPDLVRDNKLMHERLAEQDREIARLTELLRIAESKAIPVETECQHPLGALRYHGFVSGRVGDYRCDRCQTIVYLPSLDSRGWAAARAEMKARSPAETEGKRELSATEAASFDTAFSRSPRRVDETSARTHPYLCNATRFKMSFDRMGRVNCFYGYGTELDGRWVALVPAEDDQHMKGYSPMKAVARMEPPHGE